MEERLDVLQWFVPLQGNPGPMGMNGLGLTVLQWLPLQGNPGPMGVNGLGLTVLVDASYHANTSVVTHWKKRKTH